MSKEIDDGGPAFPQAIPPGFIGAGCGPHVEFGMSMRDVFACAALQGMLADHTACATAEKYALAAYKMADAMLAARKGGEE